MNSPASNVEVWFNGGGLPFGENGANMYVGMNTARGVISMIIQAKTPMTNVSPFAKRLNRLKKLTITGKPRAIWRKSTEWGYNDERNRENYQGCNEEEPCSSYEVALDMFLSMIENIHLHSIF